MKALTLAALVAASPAVAQECVLSSVAYESLADTYGEQRVTISIMPDGQIIEFWANPDTRTWSLFVTRPDGISCGIGNGVGYETFPAKPNA